MHIFHLRVTVLGLGPNVLFLIYILFLFIYWIETATHFNR